MIGKELKNLSRKELVDIIYQLKKNEQEQQEEIASLKEALKEQRIRIEASGSIADAAVSITDLFSTAQKTADIYLREIEDLKARTEQECAQKIEETEKKVKEILIAGEQQFSALASLHQTNYVQWQQQEKSEKTEENSMHLSMPQPEVEPVEEDYVMQLPNLSINAEITDFEDDLPEQIPNFEIAEVENDISEQESNVEMKEEEYQLPEVQQNVETTDDEYEIPELKTNSEMTGADKMREWLDLMYGK